MEKHSLWVRRRDHLVPYPASYTVLELVFGRKKRKSLQTE